MSIYEELKLFGMTIEQCNAKLLEHGLNCADCIIGIFDVTQDSERDCSPADVFLTKLAIDNLNKMLDKERREIRRWKSYRSILEGRRHTGAISESDIEAARNTDIVQVVSQKVELRKTNGAYFGKCPFHNEDTASFYIKNNFYHCFGCGESGDTIKFLMKTEGISFIDAVKRLA